MRFWDIVMAAATQGGGAAASPGFAAWPSLIGAEMILDPGCSDPTKWNEGAGVTVNVVAGKMVATAASSTTTNDGVLTGATLAGATYRCAESCDSRTLGSYVVSIGGTAGATRSTAATFSQDLVAVSDAGWQIVFTSATMQLDNFSVKSVALMGVEADWTFTGTQITFVSGAGAPFFGSIALSSPEETDTAWLTGSAKTAFDAAVSTSTACQMTCTFDPNGESVALQMRARGGSWVDVATLDPTTPVVVAITSGAGSGFDIRGVTGGGANNLLRVQITT